MNATNPRPAGHNLDCEEVIHVLGPIDEDTILRVIATGASTSELLEPRERLVRPGEVAEETQYTPMGVVGEIVEIVRSIEPAWDDSHDRD
ncbi:MAG: hypothetical protein P8Z76_07605 [Alphaproteobacteria bacterium]